MASRHPGHYLVDPYTWPWSTNGHRHGHEWLTPNPFVQCQSALPFWDSAISKFDHENLSSRPCVWSKVKITSDLEKVKVMAKFKLLVTFEAWSSIDMFAFLFMSIGPFWLRYRKFNIWPWKFNVKVMAKVKPDGHIWGLDGSHLLLPGWCAVL